MITFISNSGEICPVAQRMQKEGEQVQIYLHHPAYDKSFDNILSKIKLRDVPAAVRKSDLVIFDHVRPNVGLKRDHALLRIFNCDTKSPSVFGPIAEKIRKRGVKVIGTSKVTEQLELDRMFGSQMANKAGFSIPVTYDFNKLSEAQRFLEGKKSRWVLKPHNNASLDLTYVEKYPGELEYRLRNDIRTRVGTDNFPCMLQKYIEGTALSTEGWFDGQNFVSFNHTYEEKSFLSGNLGPHVGSQSNTVWTQDEEIYPEIVVKLKKLRPLLEEAGYIGPIDVNCIIAEKNEHPYFLEWTPRCLPGNTEVIARKVGNQFRPIRLDSIARQFKENQWEVLTPNGSAKITDIPNSLRDEIYTITTKRGYTLRCSSDHEIPLKNNTMIKVADLEYGYKIPININGYGGENGSYDTGYFIGLYIAEGYKVKDSALRFTFSNSEKHEILSFIQNISNPFGATVSCVQPVENENWISIYVGSKALRGLIDDYVGEHNEHYTANSKSISNAVFGKSKEFRQGILDGWAYGDGTLNHGKQEISTASKRLATQMQQLCTSLGIVTSLKTYKQSPNSKNPGAYYYRLRVGISHGLDIEDGIFWDEVSEISKRKATRSAGITMYDLKLEKGSSRTFTTANGMVVHNCGYDALFALLSTSESSISETFRNIGAMNFDERLFACSQRVSIPPYPYEIEDELKKAVSIEIRENPDLQNFWFQDVRFENGLLQCAGADGIIGVAVGTGFSIGEAANNAYIVCENIKIGSYKQYRTDMKKNAYQAAEKIGLNQGGKR